MKDANFTMQYCTICGGPDSLSAGLVLMVVAAAAAGGIARLCRLSAVDAAPAMRSDMT